MFCSDCCEGGVDECCCAVEGVIARRSGDGGVEVVFDEEVGEGLLWEEVEEVDVDVSWILSSVLGVTVRMRSMASWKFFLMLRSASGRLFSWSSVEVDDGMGRVCFLFGVVYLE